MATLNLSDPVIKGFLHDLRAHPYDSTIALIFSDYLEDQYNNLDYANFIRRQCSKEYIPDWIHLEEYHEATFEELHYSNPALPNLYAHRWDLADHEVTFIDTDNHSIKGLFINGFLYHITADYASLLALLPKAIQYQPIYKVTITDRQPAYVLTPLGQSYFWIKIDTQEPISYITNSISPYLKTTYTVSDNLLNDWSIDYATREDAHKALSHAFISWALDQTS